MVNARVVLKKSKTYNLRGRRWIKDLPQMVKTEAELEQYMSNGFFHVTVLNRKTKSVDSKSRSSRKTTKKKKGLLRKNR